MLCTKLYVCVCVFFLCQKSLPQLNEQIQKKLWDLRNELKEYEAGPPRDPRGAKQFLIQVRTLRIELSSAEEQQIENMNNLNAFTQQEENILLYQ